MIEKLRAVLYKRGFRPKKTSFWYSATLDHIYKNWFNGR